VEYRKNTNKIKEKPPEWVDSGAVREKVRVAHTLTQLPKIGAAMACG